MLTTTQLAAWNILLERPREFLSPFGRTIGFAVRFGRNVVNIVVFTSNNASGLTSNSPQGGLLSLHLLADEVPHEAIQRLVLGLISEGSAVGVHVRSIDETCTSSVADLTELLRPSHLCRSLFDLAVRIFPLGELRVADHVGIVGSRLADTVHHVVLLGELTRYALDRVDKGYFCHGVFGNRAEHRPLAFIKNASLLDRDAVGSFAYAHCRNARKLAVRFLGLCRSDILHAGEGVRGLRIKD